MNVAIKTSVAAPLAEAERSFMEHGHGTLKGFFSADDCARLIPDWLKPRI